MLSVAVEARSGRCGPGVLCAGGEGGTEGDRGKYWAEPWYELQTVDLAIPELSTTSLYLPALISRIR